MLAVGGCSLVPGPQAANGKTHASNKTHWKILAGLMDPPRCDISGAGIPFRSRKACHAGRHPWPLDPGRSMAGMTSMRITLPRFDGGAHCRMLLARESFDRQDRTQATVIQQRYGVGN